MGALLLWLSLFPVSATALDARVLLAQGQLQNDPADGAEADSPLIFENQNTYFLQPLDDSSYELGSQGIRLFERYVEKSWPWAIGTATGIAILQGVVAGMQIMYGGSPDKVEEGKTRFTWTVAGLLLLGLAAVILNILSPIFFT